MNIRYAIIEDEMYERQSLKRALERLRPEYKEEFFANSVKEAVKQLENCQTLDLIFMDIELSDGICFEIFRKVNINCPVIFTTAYDNYAIRAFKVNSIDYLLKPIMDIDLALALNKFERISRMARIECDYKEVEVQLRNKNESEVGRLLLVCGDKFNWAELNEIFLLESEDDYVFATLANGKRSLTSQRSLSKTLKILPQESFFQIDRSTIVSIKAISSVCKHFRGRLQVKVSIGGHSKSYLVSSSRRDDFLNWLGK